MSALKAIRSGNKRGMRIAGLTLDILIILVLSCGLLNAANSVYVDVVKSGESDPVTAIYSGYNYEFRIHIENDVNLGGMLLGFRIWSPDGDTWAWTNVGGYGTPHYCVTLVTGCRMQSAWDYSNLVVSEKDMDGLPPDDTVLIGGVSFFANLASGPEQHMLSLHFVPISTSKDSVVALCIDSVFIPSLGDFIFSDVYGAGIQPAISGPFCWSGSGTSCCDLGGDANNSGGINILDVGYIINYLYKEGPIPPCEEEGDANGSGGINILDVSEIINYLYKDGAEPTCP